MKSLPINVLPYKRTPEFTDLSMPSSLGHSHNTRENVWGKIIVLEGTLTYRILEPEAQDICLNPNHHGIIEPTVKHEVLPQSGVRFYVQFYQEAVV